MTLCQKKIHDCSFLPYELIFLLASIRIRVSFSEPSPSLPVVPPGQYPDQVGRTLVSLSGLAALRPGSALNGHPDNQVQDDVQSGEGGPEEAHEPVQDAQVDAVEQGHL